MKDSRTAEERVRTNLVWTHRQAEKTEVTDAEIEDEVERMAKMYGLQADDTRAYGRRRKQLRPGRIAVRKTVEMLAGKRWARRLKVRDRTRTEPEA